MNCAYGAARESSLSRHELPCGMNCVLRRIEVSVGRIVREADTFLDPAPETRSLIIKSCKKLESVIKYIQVFVAFAADIHIPKEEIQNENLLLYQTGSRDHGG